MRGRPDRDIASQTLRIQLRTAGLRVTSSRLKVLQELRHQPGPATHAHIAAGLEEAGLERTTVYRNLVDLVRGGLARRTDVGDHVWRFEARPAPDAKDHPHFLCNDCGTVECLDGLTLAPSRKAHVPRSLREDAAEILVKGVCDRCHA